MCILESNIIPVRGPKTRFKKAYMRQPWGPERRRNRCTIYVHLLRNDWNRGSGATGATLGLPLPSCKSLKYRLWGYWG